MYVGLAKDPRGDFTSSLDRFAEAHLKLYTVIHTAHLDPMAPLVFAEWLVKHGAEHDGRWLGPGQVELLSPYDKLTLVNTSPGWRNTTVHFTAERRAYQGPRQHPRLDQINDMARFNDEYVATCRTIGRFGNLDKVTLARRVYLPRMLSCRITDLHSARFNEKDRLDEYMDASKENRDNLREQADDAAMQFGDYFEARLKHAENAPMFQHEREAEMLARVDHPNTIRIEKTYRFERFMYTLQEFLTGGSLAWFMKREGDLIKVNEARVIILQAVKALQCLHHKGILHNAVSTPPIFIDMARGVPRVVLADFLKATRDGTASWAGHSPKDVFALGAVACELLTGVAPFAIAENSGEKKDGVTLLRESTTISAEAKDFVEQLLRKQDRPGIDHVAQHAWLAEEPFRSEFETVHARLSRARRTARR